MGRLVIRIVCHVSIVFLCLSSARDLHNRAEILLTDCACAAIPGGFGIGANRRRQFVTATGHLRSHSP
jgi:hypothetical protein